MLPTTFFMVLAIGYARRQLQTPALRLLKKSPSPIKVKRRKRVPKKENGFLKELSSSLIWGENRSCFCGLWLHVFCGHGSIVLWPQGLHRWYHPNHDDHDWLNPLFLDSLLSLGIVVSESRETLALMKAFGYTDRECQSHILAPYRFWAYLGFVLGTVLPIRYHGDFDRCDQRYGSWKDWASLWWECVLLDLAWFCGGLWKPLLSIQQKTPKQTIKEVLLAE